MDPGCVLNRTVLARNSSVDTSVGNSRDGDLMIDHRGLGLALGVLLLERLAAIPMVVVAAMLLQNQTPSPRSAHARTASSTLGHVFRTCFASLSRCSQSDPCSALRANVRSSAARSSRAFAFSFTSAASARAAARSSAVSDAASTFPRVSRPRRLPPLHPSGPNSPAAPDRAPSISLAATAARASSRACEGSCGSPCRFFPPLSGDLRASSSSRSEHEEESCADPGIGGRRSGALAMRWKRMAGSGIEPALPYSVVYRRRWRWACGWFWGVERSTEPRARDAASAGAMLPADDIRTDDREMGAGGANTSDFAVQANGDDVQSSVKLNSRP